MTPYSPVDLAGAGYAAYGRWVGGGDHQGLNAPDWADLPDPQRLAWIAAAREIEQILSAPPTPACACGHSALFHDPREGAPPACCFATCGCGKRASGRVSLDSVTRAAVMGNEG